MPPTGKPLSPGDVIKARFPYSNPPKFKYLLAVCVTSQLFMVISSNPYKFAPADSQIEAFQGELECLEHDSWVDGKALYEIPVGAIRSAVESGDVWRPESSLIERIKRRVGESRHLPGSQIKMVLANL